MGGAGEVGEPVLCCSWPGAPSPREILTLWKTEQAVGRGEELEEEEEEKGEEDQGLRVRGG